MMINKHNQALITYSTSMVCLFGIFAATMLVHYNGELDWFFLGIGLAQISAISIVPAVVVSFTKMSKWYFSVIAGATLGILVAVAMVKIKTGN